jgi:hypothetical protein
MAEDSARIRQRISELAESAIGSSSLVPLLSQLIIIIFCALAAGAVEKQRTLLARDTDFGLKHLVDGALGVSSEDE